MQDLAARIIQRAYRQHYVAILHKVYVLPYYRNLLDDRSSFFYKVHCDMLNLNYTFGILQDNTCNHIQSPIIV